MNIDSIHLVESLQNILSNMEESKSQQNHQKEIYNKNVLSFQQFSLSHIIGIIFVDFGRKFDKGGAYGQLFG